jgi:hypothetical protein
MTRRTKLWFGGAVLFAVLNAAGAVVALVMDGISHAAGHVLLAFIGGYVAWRIAARPGSEPAPSERVFDDRLEGLQQSLDALAVEVERVGENQRFVTKLQQNATKTVS